MHYVASASGALHVEQLYGANFSARDLTVIANGKRVASASNLAGFIDPIAQSDNVFYVGADQFVHLLTWMINPGWVEDKALDRTRAAAAAAGSPISGHETANSEEIFYLGANRHIYEVWRWSQNSDGWHPIDVTLANGHKPPAHAGSPLTGFYDSVATQDAMFYVSANEHVYELLFSSQAIWTSVDLTAASGGPNVASGRALKAHLNTASSSQELFFLDKSHNVQEIWAWASPTKFDGWHGANLNELAEGAPPAAANSPLSADVNALDDSDDIYYVGLDKNVHEMRFDEHTAQWSSVNASMTAVPPAPHAVP